MENFFDLILSSIADVIVVVDNVGIVTYASPQSLRMFGVKPEELTGKKIWEIKNFKDSERMEEFFFKLRSGGFWKKREIFEIFGEHGTVYVQIYATPLKDSSGFVLTLRDVTPSIEAQKKIEELNEVLRLLNKMLRHDLLNKLAVVRGYLEVLSERLNDQLLDKALKFADEAVELIHRMKDLEGTLLGEKLKVMNVRQVVEKVAENVRRQGVEVNILGDALVIADDALYSVFDNIFSNAIKHGEAKKIDVTIETLGKNCKITIEDYGKGLPEETIEKLFTEGFKYGERAGSGLGLYIVKKVLERYGGKIRAYNRKGAVFEIMLRSA
ncbi:MAG: PAS domain-containing sensor histidine kinase [Archaeoglobales archaeon]|nr:PAS domain-containing sensor histidine kinase [Archaeoglobales archaeon]